MRLAFVVGLALALTAPSLARAQSTEDVIVTKDGAILRGHVTELRPGKLATIVLLNGESRVIKWEEIAKSTGPSFPSDKPPATPANEDEHIDILQPGPGRVPLLVESKGKQQRIRLSVSSGVAINGFSFSISAEVCRTPCTMYLPPGDYGIESGADGITSAFTLVSVGPNGGHVKLKAASSRVWGGGLALVLAGSVTALVGGLVMAFAPLNATVSSTLTGGQSSSSSDSLLLGGGITLGAGLAMLIPGAVMMGVSKGGAVENESYDKPRPASTLQVDAAPLRDGALVGATVRF